MVTRIRQLLDTKQLTPTQFADFIGVGRPVVSHILSERNKPSLEVVQRIISAFPEVSLPWLLSGIGEMLGEATPVASASNSAPEPPQAAPASALSLSAVAPSEEEETVVANEMAEPEAQAPQSQFSPVDIPEAPVAPMAPAAAPTPAMVVPVAPQALAAAAAPRAFTASPQLLPVAPAPIAAPSTAAAIMQPFRAARFVPTVGVPAAAPRKPTAANLPTPEDSTPGSTLGSASALPPSAGDKPAASLSAVPAAGKPGPEAMLPFLGEPGKEIRRIVIFYRDGSFADYQPEA
ncbi:MAG: XRE family transcriptional regulator [Hymenobacter sp.]|nr:MAG: XRE family transcriptional regulator [Hymenobacter sp.]